MDNFNSFEEISKVYPIGSIITGIDYKEENYIPYDPYNWNSYERFSGPDFLNNFLFDKNSKTHGKEFFFFKKEVIGYNFDGKNWTVKIKMTTSEKNEEGYFAKYIWMKKNKLI